MVNYYIPYTFIAPSKVKTRCKLGGCYDDDSLSAPCPVPRVRGGLRGHRLSETKHEHRNTTSHHAHALVRTAQPLDKIIIE